MSDEASKSSHADAGPVQQSVGRPVDDDPVVGHKTYRDGPHGFRHEPLRASEADALMAAVEAADKRRAELMPDEQAAIRMMFEARQRLIELGWNDATYCPKDGTEFDAIEPGSTGIHRCHYSGEWPNGHWWIVGDGDLYPSRPVLYRAGPPKPRRKKLADLKTPNVAIEPTSRPHRSMKMEQGDQPWAVVSSEGLGHADPERAWLVEWKAHGYGPQWWGFKYTPGKHGDWCHDANDAIRFSRKVDAERMRLHVIAVAGMTGRHEYERSIYVTEHEWPNVLVTGQPLAGPVDQRVSALVPKLDRRGYAAIGLHMPKTPANVGSVLRAAHCYGATLVAQTGKRYHNATTDTLKAYRHLPLLNVDDLFSVVPYDCVPVAVDLLDDARSLVHYKHPERAFYIFGPEDGTLGKAITDRCRDKVFVPTAFCMNLAAAVNVVLYDRAAKEAR